MRRGGGATYVGNQGETTQYLEENVSSDTQPEALNKGSVSIVTPRTLFTLDESNAPAFREAFARGAIFTLSYPTQEHIDKLRKILSLEPEQVIPDDAVDPHAEIYAITARHDGGGMMYEYIAVPSANISFDESSSDVTQETVSEDSSNEVPASFTASALSEEPVPSYDEFTKQKVERFLEWTRNIDSLHGSTIQSANEKRTEIEGSFSEADIFGRGITIDGSLRSSIIMHPTYSICSFHSFRKNNDYYVVRLSGTFAPAAGQYQKGWNYVQGYASWYDLNMWLGNNYGNGNETGIRLYQHDPEHDNYSEEYTSSRGLDFGGKIAANVEANNAGESTASINPELSAGLHFGESTTKTRYDYYIEDKSGITSRNSTRWKFTFTPPNSGWDTPSSVSRNTFTPHVEAVWEVLPEYWRTKNKRYMLMLVNAGRLAKKTTFNSSEYGRTSMSNFIELTPPPHIAADTYFIQFPASGGTKRFQINASERWGFTSRERLHNLDGSPIYSKIFGPYWLTIQGAYERSNDPTGEQARTLTVTVPPFTRRGAREADIQLIGRDTGEQYMIRIRQEGTY